MSLIRNLLPFTRYPYRGEARPCDLCGSFETVTICRQDRRLKRLTTVACTGCGLLRTDPMPTDEELARYYATQYRLDYQMARGRPPRFHLKRSRRAAEVRMALLEPAIEPDKRLLDVGSGSGEFLSAAAAAGLSATGIEPGQDYAEYSRKAHGVSVLASSWDKVDLPAKSFDIVTAHHVLEHLNRPLDAMRKLTGWLKDDGILYVSVPDMSPRPKKPSFERFHFAHVYGFNPRTLSWAGYICGLEPDARFAQEGTTIVFRKRRDAIQPSEISPRTRNSMKPGLGDGATTEEFPGTNPTRHIASGRWIGDAVRRVSKDARDSIRRR